MTTWLVTRHPGAVAWISRRGIAVDRKVAHLEVGEVGAGDVVVGTLPINLAAAVCARGAEYVHLALELPADLRGRELAEDDLDRCGARLEAYRIESLGPPASWPRSASASDDAELNSR